MTPVTHSAPARWLFLLILTTAAARAQSPVITSGPNLGAWTIGGVEIPLTATGGNGAYTWNLVSGTLPPGIALRTDVPSFFPTGTAAGLIGVATTPGTYSFTVSVTSNGNTINQACTLKIIASTLKDFYQLPDGFVGVSYSYTFTPLNAVAVNWTPPSAGTMPPGLSFSNAGVISGTPTTSGAYNISFSYFDGTDTVFRTAGINVSAIQLSSAGPAAGLLPNATANTSYSATLTASGGTPPYTFSVGSLPNGLSLNASTGVISGTPSGVQGRWDFNATVTDHNNVSYGKNMAIFVMQTPEPAGYLSPYGNLDDCTFGWGCSRGINYWNGGKPPITYSVTGLPQGMDYRSGSGVTSSYIWPADLELWGTPTQLGNFNVHITATDSTGLVTSQTFVLKVSSLGVDGQDYLPNGTRGTAYSKPLRVLGGTGPYTASLSPSSQMPAGVNLSGMTVSGTPTENGFFNAEIGYADSASHSLNITEYFNISPTSNVNINNGSNLGTITLGLGYNFQLSACCVPVTWSLVGGSLPNGIGLTAGGLLSGTSQAAGTYTFTVQATDTSNSSNFGLRQFVLVVTPLNITNNFTLPFGNVGSFYSQGLNVTGASGSLTFTIAPPYLPPPGLTLNSSTGILSGTPTDTGQFLFNVTVTDSAGNTFTRTFNIYIFPPGGVPPIAITTGANLGTWSIGVHSQQLFATGGNGSYTWTLFSGTLPPGLSVRPDLPAYNLPSTSTGVLSGVLTTPGTYTFTLQAASAGQTATQTFTVKVTDLEPAETFSFPDAHVGVPYSYTLHASPNHASANWSATGLPSWATLSPSGVISGTPNVSGFTGSIQLTLQDGPDQVTDYFLRSIATYDIQITSGYVLPSPTQFLPYTTTITANGGTPPYAFTASSLPAGLTLDKNTGVLSGTTTQGAGRFGFTLTVTDSHNVTRSRATSIVVLGAPERLITLAPYSYSQCAVGSPCNLGIIAANGGTPPFTYTATGLPAGMMIRTVGAGTSPTATPNDAEIFGEARTAGTYNVQITATDANGKTSVQTIPFIVSEMFVEGVDTLPAGTRGTPYSKLLRVIGGTGPYTVAQTGGQIPAGLALSGLTVSGTPTENGNFTVELTYTDSLGRKLITNQFPNISGGTSTININQSYNLGTITTGSTYSNQLTACCVPSYVWSQVSGTLPPGISISPSGLLSGTANIAGTYVFVIKAADASNSANFGVRQFQLVVTPINITAGGGLPSGNVGTFYSQTLAATGGTGTITWSLAPENLLPPGLTLTAGVLSGTPAQPGFFLFSISATDAAGNIFVRSFNIQIYPAGVLPPLSINIGPNLGSSAPGVQTFQLTASGGLPPYHFSYSPGATVIPGMRVLDGPPLPVSFASNVTGGFAGVITATGVYTTSLRVTDANNTVFDRPITWTIVDTAPLALNPIPRAQVGVPFSFTFPGYGGSGNYSWSATNLPPGLSMSTAGVLSGMPTSGGQFFPTITITDLANNISTAFGYTVNVNPFAITTAPVFPKGAIGTPYTLQLQAPNCGSGCNWSFVSGGQPGGLNLSASGLVTGTPNSFFEGGFVLQASGSNGVAQQQFSLLIDFNTPQPLFINMGSTIGPTNLGNTNNAQLFAQGGTPPYTWTLDSGTLPPGIRLGGPGETLGTNQLPGFTYLAGRPMQVGSYTFTVRVTDAASATTTKTLTWIVAPLSVNGVNFPTASAPLIYNTPYTQPLLALGGTGVYSSWQVVSGSLPPGLTLNASTGVVSGSPTNTGSFTAGIRVTDTAGNQTTQNVTFAVAGPGGVVVNTGTSDSYTIQMGFTNVFGWNPSGGTGPYMFSALTPLPPGCTIEAGNSMLANNGNTYALVCSPLAPGDFTFTIQVTDSAGNIGIRTLALHVAPFTLFSSTVLPNGSVGSVYSTPLIAFNAGNVVWSVAAGSALPPGLNLTGAAITGTPTAAGNYSFTLNGTDTVSGITTGFGFSLTISTIHINTPDIIPQQVIANLPYSFTMTATGGGTKTWTASGLPNGLSMSVTGTISGTTFTTGTFRVVVTVTDGASTYTHPFTLFVRYNDPSIPNIQPASTALLDVHVGQSTTITLSPTGGFPPFTWTVAPGSSLPPGLNLYSGNSLSAYSSTQTVGLTYLQGAPTTVGSYSFDLIATDSTGVQMRRTYTINVKSMTIVGGNLKTAIVGVPYAQQLTASGGIPPYTFTYSKSGLNTDMMPPGIAGSPAGLISGTATSTGAFAFFVTAQDSVGHTFLMSYSLPATNANGLEVTSPPVFGARAGVSFSTTLVTNGTSSYTWSISGGALPPGVTLNSAGALAGAPAVPGVYNYTVRATDTANGSNVADRAYSMLVGSVAANVHRASTLPPARMGTPYSYTMQVTGGTPPFTYATLALSPLPPGLTLSPSGLLSGTPTAIGNYTFTYAVTDGAGLLTYLTTPPLPVLGPGQQNPISGASLILFDASVGVPTATQLDQGESGGVAPFTWSVAPGSSLPPGLSIAPGSNGVSAYLTGVATTPGTYTFSLNVTDAAGQVATSQFTIAESVLSASPFLAPSGNVGTPYSFALTASGGTPPYSFAPTAASPMPPGLALSSNGVISGTPTVSGWFVVNLVVTDSASHTLLVGRLIDIDQAGQSQGIDMTPPDVLQLNYVLTSPTPAPIPINVTSTSGTAVFTAMVSGIPGATLTPASGNTPSTMNLNLNTAGLSAGTYAGVIAVAAPQTSIARAAIPVLLTVTTPPPCTYGLSPTGGSVGAAGGTGSFSLSTGSLCAWSATASDPTWITITSGAGPGPGNVGYSVMPNPGINPRTGSISAGGQSYSITQFGSSCSFAINPTSVNATAAGGIAIVNVTASNSACVWTASGLGASPASGTGDLSVSLTIPANASPSGQVLNATIAGQTFTVNQSGINCTVGLGSAGVNVGSAGGTGAVNVTTPTGCSYSTVNGPGWITVTSGGSGAGPGPVALNFSVAPNSTTVGRSGALTVGGQTFTITQDPTPCSVTVDTSGLGSPFGAGGGAGTIGITANGPNCSWTASSGASWATVLPASGTGNATVNVTAGSNAASAVARSTNLTIAGQTVTLAQAGTACTYGLGSPTASVPFAGGSGSVTVTAPSVCGWSSSPDASAPWLSITSSGSQGTGEVNFTASANPNAAPRTGVLTVAGQSYTVTQGAAPCNYTLSGPGPALAAVGASSSFTFSTAAVGCSTNAVSYSSWLTVSTVGGNTPAGSVNYTAAPNPSGATRTGTIQFGGQTFTVTQLGAACAFSLNAYGAAVSKVGASANILASQSATGCPAPPYGTDQPSYVSLGTLTGPVSNIWTLPYMVQFFNSTVTTTRKATISIGGQVFTIKQTSW